MVTKLSYAVLLLVGYVLCAQGPLYAQALRFYHVDVDQASATLIVAPNGKTLLVDCGEDGMGSRVKNVMDDAGVNQIDFFVLTHYHKDHYGGIDELVEGFDVPVWQAYDRGEKNKLTADKRNEPAYKNYQRAVGEDAIRLTPGMTISLDSAMTIKCISSGGYVIDEATPRSGRDENDKSISLLVTYAGFSYFIGGDTEKATETKIAARDLVMDVDVYIANHHGSHSSSSPVFMNDLLPRVVVISNGDRADYQHPRIVTLETFASLPEPPTVFQTNKCFNFTRGGGNVADAFIADPETADDDGTILITVEPATAGYTVTYGASASNTFSIKNPAEPFQLVERIVIVKVLPNPTGSDEQLETVTLKNLGAVAVSLSGWTLRDRGGLVWTITGQPVLAPGSQRTIRRNGMPMSLNNAGDEIELLDVENVVRDAFIYDASEEGVTITTDH